MTASPPGTRRRHRRSRASRLLRRLGLRSGRFGQALLGLGAVVALAAVAVALSGGSGTADPAAASSPLAPGAAATASLPALPGLPSPPPVSWAPSDALGSPPPISGGGGSASPSAGVVAQRIQIDRLGIDLPIIEGDGYEAPMYKAAHYPGTGWPHGGVNIYIYAHAQPGMFLALWGAQVGDIVTLRLVDGTTAQYQVTQVLPKVAWDALQYADPTPPERLTLQTSTGYTATSPRFVVLAEPMASASGVPSASPGATGSTAP